MKQKRTMASQAKIVKHWNLTHDTTFDNTYCWGCGQKSDNLHRAHLLAHSAGGSGEEDNLILLCWFCHCAIQEPLSSNQSDADYVKKLILDGLPFFRIHWAFYAEKIKSGLYDNTCLTHVGISNNDLENFKKYAK